MRCLLKVLEWMIGMDDGKRKSSRVKEYIVVVRIGFLKNEMSITLQALRRLNGNVL